MNHFGIAQNMLKNSVSVKSVYYSSGWDLEPLMICKMPGAQACKEMSDLVSMLQYTLIIEDDKRLRLESQKHNKAFEYHLI